MTQDRYADDPSIPDSAALWRRVPPWHFVRDENLGRVRPSSAAFADDADGAPMSVVLADLVTASGRQPADVLLGHTDFGLAEITVGLVRSCGQGVARDATPTEPAHAVVFGRKTKGVQRLLAKKAVWVVAPPEQP